MNTEINLLFAPFRGHLFAPFPTEEIQHVNHIIHFIPPFHSTFAMFEFRFIDDEISSAMASATKTRQKLQFQNNDVWLWVVVRSVRQSFNSDNYGHIISLSCGRYQYEFNYLWCKCDTFKCNQKKCPYWQKNFDKHIKHFLRQNLQH